MANLKRPPESGNNPQHHTSYQERIAPAFAAYCRARAVGYWAGRLELQAAVDWCQDWAFTRGLVELIGQDAVQQIMADAFHPEGPRR